MTGAEVSLVTAVVTGGVTLLVCLINNHYQRSRFQAIVELKLEELQRHVDRHNDLIDRTYRLEEQLSLQREKLRTVGKRMETLERFRATEDRLRSARSPEC